MVDFQVLIHETTCEYLPPLLPKLCKAVEYERLARRRIEKQARLSSTYSHQKWHVM